MYIYDVDVGNIAERATDMRTILVAATISGFIFVFILGFFCVVFKSNLERKRKMRRKNALASHQRQQNPLQRQRRQQQHQRQRSGRNKRGGGGVGGQQQRHVS